MRNRPFMIAALSAACCLLPLTAGNLISSQVWASQVLSVASEDAATTNGSRGETAPSDNPPAILLDKRNVQGILGNAVRSAADEDMGRIVDVIVDRTGTARAAVIDFGGFLGVGSRKIAIDWSAMRFTSLDRITVDMTREQVKAAPVYEAGKPIIVLGAALEFARSRVTERMPER